MLPVKDAPSQYLTKITLCWQKVGLTVQLLLVMPPSSTDRGQSLAENLEIRHSTRAVPWRGWRKIPPCSTTLPFNIDEPAFDVLLAVRIVGAGRAVEALRVGVAH